MLKYVKGDFFVVPNQTSLKGMHYRDRSAFMALCSMADDNGVCWPSFQTLAEHAGMSRTSAIEAIRMLEAQGFIERTARARADGSQTSNEYQICLVRPPSTPGDLGVVREATTNNIHLEQHPHTSEQSSQMSENLDEDTTLVACDDWGEEFNPRKSAKKDTTYRKVFAAVGGVNYPLAWNTNRTQIQAAKNLLQEHGLDKVKKAMKWYKEHKDEPFCPQLSTPHDLDNKWHKALDFKYRDR